MMLNESSGWYTINRSAAGRLRYEIAVLDGYISSVRHMNGEWSKRIRLPNLFELFDGHTTILTR